MSSRQHFLKMTQICRHGDDMILDISEIHANVHMWSYLIVFIASLRETAKDVGFASEETKQSHAILANSSNRAEKRARIVLTHHEDFVFNGICLEFDGANSWREAVNYVIADGHQID